MSAKISNLSELYPVASNEEKISEGVLAMIGRFDLKALLSLYRGSKPKELV